MLEYALTFSRLEMNLGFAPTPIEDFTLNGLLYITLLAPVSTVFWLPKFDKSFPKALT